MKQILITGWRVGANKVAADELLAYKAGLGLDKGKALIDAVLNGAFVRIDVIDDQVAETLVEKLQALNFEARID